MKVLKTSSFRRPTKKQQTYRRPGEGARIKSSRRDNKMKEFQKMALETVFSRIRQIFKYGEV